MPPKNATPKKAAPQGKVVMKWTPPAGPISVSNASKWIHKVYTASTQAKGIFITWASKPNGQEASFVKPLRTHYEQLGVEQELPKEWKIHGIYPRRDRKDLDANKVLPGNRGSTWPWDCFVTICVAAEGDTAKSTGKHIAKVLTEFAAQADEFKDQKHKPKYAFCGDASEASRGGLKPLSHFLLDEHVVEVFKSLFEDGNEKDLMMDQDDLLKSFFGSAEKGREMLEDCIWGGSN